jgi:hypothetical protein
MHNEVLQRHSITNCNITMPIEFGDKSIKASLIPLK